MASLVQVQRMRVGALQNLKRSLRSVASQATVSEDSLGRVIKRHGPTRQAQHAKWTGPGPTGTGVPQGTVTRPLTLPMLEDLNAVRHQATQLLDLVDRFTSMLEDTVDLFEQPL